MVLVKKIYSIFLLLFVINLFSFSVLFAEKSEKIPIRVTGKKISYLENGQKVVAKGHVLILYKNMRLTCDEAEVDLSKNTALAKGNVVLVEARGVMHGDYLEYNFKQHKGKLLNADFTMLPYYGGAQKVEQESVDHYKVSCGYFTTCDPSKPHPLNYRLEAKSVDIYPGEKVVARKVRFKIGRYTLMYFPKYVHYFHSKSPNVKIVPGKDNDWGFFVLTSWKYHLSEDITGKMNIDFREKRGIGFGPDLFYGGKYGYGSLRMYYIDEKDKELLEDLGGYRQKKRYKIQWVHRYNINKNDSLIIEYNKFSDYFFLKDYYYNDEYEYNTEPDSYILYRHTSDYSVFSCFIKKRVNHFYTKVEYLPQLKYSINSYPVIGDKVYVSGSVELDNLSKRYAYSLNSINASRWDNYMQMLYSSKWGYFDVSPFIGLRETYYSRGIDSDGQFWRGVFYTGIDISTKLYKVFNFDSDFWGIHKVRHVLRPWIKYLYNSKPTVLPDKLQQFDSLDSITKQNDLFFGIENLFQTKRDSKTVDFARGDLSFLYHITSAKGSYFDYAKIDLELHPLSWVRLDFDYTYGLDEGKWRKGLFDLWFDYKKNFSVGIGHQYEVNQTAQTTLETKWNIIPGWKFRTYHRYDFEHGLLQESTYSVVKDLKCWEMEIDYTNEHYGGSTFWFIMRIKAFPDIGMKISKSYGKPRRGVVNP